MSLENGYYHSKFECIMQILSPTMMNISHLILPGKGPSPSLLADCWSFSLTWPKFQGFHFHSIKLYHNHLSLQLMIVPFGKLGGRAAERVACWRLWLQYHQSLTGARVRAELGNNKVELPHDLSYPIYHTQFKKNLLECLKIFEPLLNFFKSKIVPTTNVSSKEMQWKDLGLTTFSEQMTFFLFFILYCVFCLTLEEQ